MSVTYAWRGDFDSGEVSLLRNTPSQDDWWTRVNRHSLGWACARDGDELVGFVNVAWDGGAHAFVLDPTIHERLRRHGIGTALVAMAADQARAAGCEWLHVDFEDHLAGFYFDACGFTSTKAGVIRLSS